MSIVSPHISTTLSYWHYWWWKSIPFKHLMKYPIITYNNLYLWLYVERSVNVLWLSYFCAFLRELSAPWQALLYNKEFIVMDMSKLDINHLLHTNSFSRLSITSITVHTYFDTATLTRGVVGAPFHRQLLPHTKAIATFHPATATGKLKALMIPTTPRGFQFSIRTCPGPECGYYRYYMLTTASQCCLSLNISYCCHY